MWKKVLFVGAKKPTMGFLVGAMAGVGVQLYSNAVRKLPLMRREYGVA